MPWQQYVADVALELNPDGSLVYGAVGLEVGRQEGKTELKFVIAVLRMTAMAATHGPQVATYTMQDRASARKRLERVYIHRLRAAKGFKYIDPQSRVRPSRSNEWRPGLNSGVEHIQFGQASYLQIDTPSATGGHGDTLDLGMIDEAFAHEDATVENNMEPAMLARPDTQLWWLSAAGHGKSKFLYRKVLAGRTLVADGCDEGIAYFEWSAPDDADPSDPRVWRSCCPSMDLLDISEDKLRALYLKALREGPEALDKFRRSYLSQWPEVPVLDDDIQHRVIPSAEWAACEDEHSVPSDLRRYAVDVDVNASGESWCSVALSDARHVEIVKAAPGTDWLVPAVTARRDEVGELVIHPSAAAGKLVTELEKAGISLKKVTESEFVQASQQYLDSVLVHRVRHMGQPQLDRAVAGAARRDSGDGAWRFSRKLSSVDISPLVATVLARWAADSGSDPAQSVW